MTDYINPRLVIDSRQLKAGRISWRSPSNLAIIKYWGKYDRQLPRNPSISFTLDKAYTQTTIEFAPGNSASELELDFYFNNQPKEDFRIKLLTYLKSITPVFPFIKQLQLVIHSTNSFPHSAGIASSASALSAVALCLCSLEHQLFDTLKDDDTFRQKASYVARLGSGSACRSIFPGLALWGKSLEVEGSSDEYAIQYKTPLHKVYESFHDDILIVSKGEKQVSSRAGHGLMEDNIYAEVRYQQARQRLHQLLLALQNGDLDSFGMIAENEALTLHALMMSSPASFILLQPNSLKLIEMVRSFRQETKLPLYFSLDAGPNLHLLYPDEIKAQVQPFIQDELSRYCEDGEWIADQVGAGPLQLE